MLCFPKRSSYSYVNPPPGNFRVLRTSSVVRRPYRGQCQRPIGLEQVLDLENLTLECPGTLTGAVLDLKTLRDSGKGAYFGQGLVQKRGISETSLIGRSGLEVGRPDVHTKIIVKRPGINRKVPTWTKKSHSYINNLMGRRSLKFALETKREKSQRVRDGRTAPRRHKSNVWYISVIRH